jgi:non-lysosomal glucosylceramidase
VALLPGGTPTRPAGLADRAPARPGTYHALYPAARYSYGPDLPGDGVEVEVTQWSPVLAGRESESAWPVGYLEVTLRNTSERARTLAVALALELPVDDRSFQAPTAVGEVELRADEPLPAGLAAAVARLPEADASFAVAVDVAGPSRDGVGPEPAVSARPLLGDASYDRFLGGLWPALTAGSAGPARALPQERPGLAAGAKVAVAPGATVTVAFSIAWDLPRIRFGKELEHAWWRAYTTEFGRSGAAAGRIATNALACRAELAAELAAWHHGLAAELAEADAPPWLLSALCNELYVMVEGGTAWVVGPAGAGIDGLGSRQAEPVEEHFGVLECPDYPFYETLDVRYYSSFALLELWPRLERVVMRDFATEVLKDEGTLVTATWNGTQFPRNRGGSAPHDLGGPFDDAFRAANAYDLQDVSVWKDLNAKLVLEIARDVALLDDADLARDTWPACRTALRYLEQFDRDGDGVIEHDDAPDQTYDTWPMHGVSAYCGDLWVAALGAGELLARRAGDTDEADRLAALRARAEPRVEELLWRGDRYRFDSSGGASSDDILADQFAGTWYLLLLGLPPAHPPERVHAALSTVLRFNLDGFEGGRLGPVNGRGHDGGPPAEAGEQASEVWVGAAWSLASLCLLTGRDADAWRIGEALYATQYGDSGLWFRTPEAWTAEREFRAARYHRALAVWSLLTALRVRAAAARRVAPPVASAAS